MNSELSHEATEGSKKCYAIVEEATEKHWQALAQPQTARTPCNKLVESRCTMRWMWGGNLYSKIAWIGLEQTVWLQHTFGSLKLDQELRRWLACEVWGMLPVMCSYILTWYNLFDWWRWWWCCCCWCCFHNDRLSWFWCAAVTKRIEYQNVDKDAEYWCSKPDVIRACHTLGSILRHENGAFGDILCAIDASRQLFGAKFDLIDAEVRISDFIGFKHNYESNLVQLQEIIAFKTWIYH